MNDTEWSRLDLLATHSHQGLNPEALPNPHKDRWLLLGEQFDGDWIGFILMRRNIVFLEFSWESGSGSQPVIVRSKKINPEHLFDPNWLASGHTCVEYTDFEFAREMLRIFGKNFTETLWDVSFSPEDKEILKGILDQINP